MLPAIARQALGIRERRVRQRERRSPRHLEVAERGGTWEPLSVKQDRDPLDNESTFLDLAIDVRVDPNDSNHLYATDGVRGHSHGFWESVDGGANWSRERFTQYAPTHDFTTLAVDPTDFDHVIIGSHACCEGTVMESRDGGETWNVVRRVVTIDHAGELHERSPAQYRIGYRTVARRCSQIASVGSADAIKRRAR